MDSCKAWFGYFLLFFSSIHQLCIFVIKEEINEDINGSGFQYDIYGGIVSLHRNAKCGSM